MQPRVLIIDDNSGFRAALGQLLERNGFVVVAEAGDGATGIREAKTQKPDLAIVDVQLPGCDGFQVAEQLSRLELEFGVILTSSLDGADFGALVTSSSALGFIPKAELSGPAIEALLAPTR
jgi:DNA-binding NarL/FixJ family response regulator